MLALTEIKHSYGKAAKAFRGRGRGVSYAYLSRDSEYLSHLSTSQ